MLLAFQGTWYIFFFMGVFWLVKLRCSMRIQFCCPEHSRPLVSPQLKNSTLFLISIFLFVLWAVCMHPRDISTLSKEVAAPWHIRFVYFYFFFLSWLGLCMEKNPCCAPVHVLSYTNKETESWILRPPWWSSDSSLLAISTIIVLIS